MMDDFEDIFIGLKQQYEFDDVEIKEFQTAYICTNGEVINSGRKKYYCEPLRSGDVVGLLLDMVSGEIRFEVNGVDKGVAVTHPELKNGIFFTQVTLYSRHN
jgi:hypothetical protein